MREREGKRERVCERNYNSKWENYDGKYNDLVKCLSVKSHKILKLKWVTKKKHLIDWFSKKKIINIC